MFRKALIFTVCAGLCLVGSGATKTHEGLSYSTTAVKTGVWSTQFSKCKKYAKKLGVPLVVLWVNPGCGHCKTLCNDIAASSDFEKWRKACGYVFVLGIGTKTELGAQTKAFAKSDGSSILHAYPFCAVYLNPLGSVSPAVKKVFTGNGLTAKSFRSKAKSVIKKYAKIKLTACDENGKASDKYGKVVQVRWQKIGKKVTLTAKPKRGCSLIGWYDANGECVSKKTDYRIKVKKSTKYTARFRED